MKELWNRYKFLRFGLIGLVNTLFGMGVYSLAIWCGLSYSIAFLVSTILGVLFNFKTTGTFVFKNKSNALIFKFILSYAIVYFINVGLTRLFVNSLGINTYYAGYIAMIISACCSYIILNLFVYKK